MYQLNGMHIKQKISVQGGAGLWRQQLMQVKASDT